MLAALEQRITVQPQMKGMTPDETASYVRHHLEQAERTAKLFTDDAVANTTTPPAASPNRQQHLHRRLDRHRRARKNLVDHASARAGSAEVTATRLAPPDTLTPPARPAGRGHHIM